MIQRMLNTIRCCSLKNNLITYTTKVLDKQFVAASKFGLSFTNLILSDIR